MIAAERLVLRLEPRSLDLATTLPLLRRHRLHSALLAVRASRGDYVSSVEEVRDLSVLLSRCHTPPNERALFWRPYVLGSWLSLLCVEGRGCSSED